MAISNNNMMPPQPTSFAIFLNFIKDSWPMIGGIVGMWKVIDEAAKYFSKKQEAKLRELIKEEVNPQVSNLISAINELREEIGRLKVK